MGAATKAETIVIGWARASIAPIEEGMPLARIQYRRFSPATPVPFLQAIIPNEARITIGMDQPSTL